MTDREIRQIRYGSMDVSYASRLNGGGMGFGQDYVPVIRKKFGRVKRACEFASGPGFIGFSLLAHGLCDSLCLIDVNPDTIELCKKTIRENHLENRVSAFVSDGLAGVPESEYRQWDLVVSNPPHFDGSEAEYGENILLIDPGWRIHKEFYAGIKKFLAPGGSVLFMENGDGSRGDVWRPMAAGAGLAWKGAFSYKPFSLYLRHRRAYYSRDKNPGMKTRVMRLGKAVLAPVLYLKWRMSYPYYFTWSENI